MVDEYGFYCLEAAIAASAAHVAINVPPVHWKKAEVARMLHEKYGLPNIEELLVDLNQARKGAAYGDVELPDLDPEDVARRIEEYVEAVRHFVSIGEGENG